MKYLFNPFIFLAGTKALTIGWSVMLLTMIIAYLSQVHFNGAIDAHVLEYHSPVAVYAFEQLIAWGSLVIALYGFGLVFSKSSIRFIDIAGTVALARTPMILVALIGFVPALHHVSPNNISTGAIITSLLMLIPVIWMIALLYHAFSVSANLKSTKATLGFILGLIASEALSVFLNYQLQLHFI